MHRAHRPPNAKPMRRTLRRTELTEIVCGVPYAAQN